MAFRLKSTKSKSSESFSIIDDYVNPTTGKRSTYIVEALGSLSSLMEKYQTDNREDVIKQLIIYIQAKKEEHDELNGDVTVTLPQSTLHKKDETVVYNLGYLYIRNILCAVGIKKICNKIQDNYKFKYNLFDILCDLICARIIFPNSKRATFSFKKRFLHHTDYELEDVYRALQILYKERYTLESAIYNESKNIYNRDSSILFYDCTNFYFEIEDADDFRLYGVSKEHRPNPIVQYGLFMDAKGVPLIDYPFAGNMNEQPTLRAIEKKVEEEFHLKKFIVVADAGLNGWENKVYNNMSRNRAYIVTQPIKKLNESLREWVTNPKGWQIEGVKKKFDLENIVAEAEEKNIDIRDFKIEINGKMAEVYNLMFYKERWDIKSKKSTITNNKYSLEERYIASFSFRQQAYHKYIRDKKLERAKKLINKPSSIKKKDQRNPKYYITERNVTSDGECADNTVYRLDYDKINEEEKLDGFYVVTTDLEDKNPKVVIQANKQRWEIEESFRIMKSELNTRPMYVRTEETIYGHLLVCFLALLVYRILEKYYLSEKFTTTEIITGLRNMNITYLIGGNYISSFERTDFTDKLTEIFGFENSRKVISQKYLKKFLKVVNSEKSTKLQ